MTQQTQVSDWQPAYTPWRHGGWYVSNIRYIGGAVGCVSNNYPDKKWRIVSDARRVNGLGEEGDFFFQTRDAAARAERDRARAEVETELIKWTEMPDGGGYRQNVGEFDVHIGRNFEGYFFIRIGRAGREVRVLNRSTGCFEQALEWGMDEVKALREAH